MKTKYIAKQGFTDKDIKNIKDVFGASHGESLLVNGFYENSLPHGIMEDENLLHLFIETEAQ